MVESSKIKRLREKLDLSQEKLARLADVSNNTIINIEAGKQQNPTVDTIKKIAKALNVPIEDLIKYLCCYHNKHKQHYLGKRLNRINCRRRNISVVKSV